MKKFKIILALSLPFQYLVYSIFLSKPSFADGFYFPFIFQNIAIILNKIVASFEWATLDVIFILLGLTIVWLSYKSLRIFFNFLKNIRIVKKYSRDNLFRYFKKYSINVLAVLALFYGMFMWLWGFNYYRTPLEKSLAFKTQEITIAELDSLARVYIKQANNYRVSLLENDQGVMILPERKKWINKSGESFSEDAKYFQEYPEFKIWKKNSPAIIKELKLSWVLSVLATSGIYNVLSTEANVNISQPHPMIPIIACHEIAHQVGIAPENEANFVGFVAAREHQDQYYKYSAALMASRYLINAVYREDPVRGIILRDNYSKAVRRDIDAIRDYWSKTHSKFQDASRDIYDFYLKFNQQKDGIKTYSQVVRLIVGEARSSTNKIK